MHRNVQGTFSRSGVIGEQSSGPSNVVATREENRPQPDNLLSPFSTPYADDCYVTIRRTNARSD